MVDYFALALSHSLLVFAAWQLLWRADLDADPATPEDHQPDQNGGNAAAAQELRPKVGPSPGLRLRA